MAGGAALGKDFTRARRYKEVLEELGFVDVVEKRTQFPVGTWAVGKKMKTLGAWMKMDMLAGLQAMSMAIMTRGLGMTPEEVAVHLENVKTEIESNKLHAYFPVYVIPYSSGFQLLISLGRNTNAAWLSPSTTTDAHIRTKGLCICHYTSLLALRTEKAEQSTRSFALLCRVMLLPDEKVRPGVKRHRQVRLAGEIDWRSGVDGVNDQLVIVGDSYSNLAMQRGFYLAVVQCPFSRTTVQYDVDVFIWIMQTRQVLDRANRIMDRRKFRSDDDCQTVRLPYGGARVLAQPRWAVDEHELIVLRQEGQRVLDRV